MPFDGKEMPLSETVKKLMAVREILVQGWCRYNLAVNVHGENVHWDEPEAVRWCLLGAIDKADAEGVKLKLSQNIPGCITGGRLAVFNNAQETVVPVLDLIDRTIDAELNYGIRTQTSLS